MPSSSSLPRIAVINVVGLCQRLLGDRTPFMTRFARENERATATIEPLLPAVTSTMQATYLTGKPPGDHGIVANYWYDRTYGEHRGWKQSNHLVSGPKLWETIRETRPDYTCAKVFWWNNLYSSADYTITPRPIYCADGKKVFDIQTWPMDLREQIKGDLGDFPFPAFWGPAAGLSSSRWIAQSARWFEERFQPHLNLIYLPHLDYNLQRFGPDAPSIDQDIREIDGVVEELVTYLEKRNIIPVILSEYGITPVRRPIHINRAFREHGWIVCREELGKDQIDPGYCEALAISDHQLAHIYVKTPSMIPEVANVVSSLPGVSRVLTGEDILQAGLGHERSGDIVAIADEESWFTYYYWEDDKKAPDFARCVDIHRKPGYDPAELFVDPAISAPKLQIAWRLLRKKLGFRMLMDLIPLDAELVKGSHGCIPQSPGDYPVVIGPGSTILSSSPIPATKVHDYLLDLALNQK